MRYLESTIRQRSPGAPASARFGAVAFVHRFGSYLNSHVHYHVLVSDGVFSAGPDGEAVFHPALDLDGDYDLDLYVANDSNPNYVYQNQGDGTFQEVGLWSGAALDAIARARPLFDDLHGRARLEVGYGRVVAFYKLGKLADASAVQFTRNPDGIACPPGLELTAATRSSTDALACAARPSSASVPGAGAPLSRTALVST